MYRRRLKQKAVLLLCMVILLCVLAVKGRREERKEGETGEALRIPKEQEEEVPKEEWRLPGDDAKIRVLLLNGDGGIYHKDRTLAREYPGRLQYYETGKGTVIVNEVPLEDYLCLVVPSEMPASYAEEALKAQAICARTYAVWQMQEYAYPEYEAHVDDSVSYQVYNNQDGQEASSRAVEETKGRIMLYEDRPVKAYYFATSCGSTTDEEIWEEGDKNVTPYIAGRRVGDSNSKKDLSDKEVFSKFIRKKHAGDLEVSEPWYRWTCYVPLSQIRENVERWIKVRAAKTKDGILMEDGGDYVWPDVDTIGEIKGVEVIERCTGGAARQMMVTGEKGTLKIQYEYNIRLMLGIPGGSIEKNDGTTGKGGNLLPSGYFVLDPVEKDEELVGYQVIGGGLGHGAGMSQNGARILAEQGCGYEEILQYFYSGIRLALLGNP